MTEFFAASSPPYEKHFAKNFSLRVADACIGYDQHMILDTFSLSIPDKSFTVIVGPNGCGKSTLLRAISRQLIPSSRQIILDGKSIHSYRSKEVAQYIGLLPQSAHAPDGMRVVDLVSRGRYPYQNLLRQWSQADEQAVGEAMAATGVSELSGRSLEELSGGQRQRVWVAMALARQTDILALDEPTTYLDIAHQIEIMELFTQLHRGGRTLIAVLHDLNQATRYATNLVVMRRGCVVAQGVPSEIVTAELIDEAFGLKCMVYPDPVTGTPAVSTLGSKRRSG